MRFVFAFLLLVFLPVQSFAANNDIKFEILRDGKPFGTHTISFEKEKNNTTKVKIDINMAYVLGPVTLFRYAHENKEVWQGDRILSAQTTTNDDGDKFLVEATWDRERLEVRTKDKLYDAPATAYSSSYWNKNALKSSNLLNTQYGDIEKISVTNEGVVTMNVAGQDRKVRKYKVQAKIPITVYYDVKTNEWVGLEFTARGAPVTYRRLNPVGS